MLLKPADIEARTRECHLYSRLSPCFGRNEVTMLGCFSNCPTIFCAHSSEPGCIDLELFYRFLHLLRVLRKHFVRWDGIQVVPNRYMQRNRCSQMQGSWRVVLLDVQLHVHGQCFVLCLVWKEGKSVPRPRCKWFHCFLKTRIFAMLRLI